MKKILFAAILSACFVNSSLSQESTPPSSPPPSSPPPSVPTAPAQQSIQNNQNTNQDRQRRMDNQLSNQREMMNVLFPANLRQDISVLYRRTNKKEMKLLSVNADDKRKYEAFLKAERTGLIKLIPNLGCSENSKVIVASEECLKYSMPGGGSSYSFRINDYRSPQLADLTFLDSTFETNGLLSQGIITEIGDVSLESVSLQSPGVKYLSEIEAVTEYEEAVKFQDKMLEGVAKDGFFYGSRINAIEHRMYVLRSIAYEGKAPRSFNGFTYNEMDFDKRKDVIIAFRVVRKENDGSVTLLWKELARTKSPKMKPKKKEDKESENSKEKFTAKNL